MIHYLWTKQLKYLLLKHSLPDQDAVLKVFQQFIFYFSLIISSGMAAFRYEALPKAARLIWGITSWSSRDPLPGSPGVGEEIFGSSKVAVDLFRKPFHIFPELRCAKVTYCAKIIIKITERCAKLWLPCEMEYIFKAVNTLIFTLI